MILKMHLGKGLKFSKNIILASNSPRRAEILHDLGINFEKKVIPTEEKTKAIEPRKMVLDIAYKKGIEVYKENKNSIVISADTIVYKDKVYTKPRDGKDAFRILKELSGRWHKVYTGVWIFSDKKTISFTKCSRVKLKRMNTKMIDEYIEKYQPLDKAGSYGIQDGAVVEKYIGSYTNIVGLPKEKLAKMIKLAD